MCGIAGFATTQRLDANADMVTLRRMTDALQHRGPDDCGYRVADRIALGHRRLSIIDLSQAGRQPMSNEDDTVRIAFNGEIYNFQSLRDQLAGAGHQFSSRTDTEVLVHGYEQWGLEGLLERVEGMFAFALWDESQRALYLVRDRFGIKPLYWSRRNGRLLFGSELKSLVAYDERRPAIDRNGLLLSLHHGGTPAPTTVYEGCHQLEPATWLRFNTDDDTTAQGRYWAWQIDPVIHDKDEAVTRMWEAIVGSVENHLVADVPVGVFLSGGLDSSLVVAACAELGRKPACLTIAMDDPAMDESPLAAQLCAHFGMPHHIERMDADAGRRYDDRLAQVYDEPFGSSAALSALHVNEIGAGQFKVALTGDGGDELFGGYGWYRKWIDWYGPQGRPVPLWQRPVNGLRSCLGRKAMPADPMAGFALLLGGYSHRQMRRILDRDLINDSDAADAANAYRRIDRPDLAGFDRLQWLDLHHFLPTECLTKMDRASMAFSLELRVPLLDRQVAELAGKVAASTRNPNFEPKALLKRIARSKLPPALLGKKKQGFSTRTRMWFDKDRILEQLRADQASGRWWQGVFAPNVSGGASSLRGRQLWRFWHLWRWVKEHQGN
jgi:asparagine synthase (glutamine-hydrolysing)